VTTIDLTEWGTARELDLSAPHVAMLAASKYVKVAPDPQRAGKWQVSAQSYVGAVSFDGLEIRIRPKVDLRRLLSLLSRHLGQVTFAADNVDWGDDDDLTSMIAAAFATETEKLLAQGLLNGYRAVDESLLTIRGRIDMGRHVAARAGLPLPVEVTYDDFTPDIAENQLLAGAAARLLRITRLDSSVRRRLQRIGMMLHEVTPTFSASTADNIVWSRLNERYRTSVGLAVLVLKATTIEDTASRGSRASAFVVDMSAVFEAEVAARLRDAARGLGVTLATQYSASLDEDGYVGIRPDLAVLEHRQLVAIADTKYKLPDIRGVDVSDLYQVLAYAHRFRLPAVHLIYPVPPPKNRLVVGDVVVHLHHVDLDLSRSETDETYSRLLGHLCRSPLDSEDQASLAGDFTRKDQSNVPVA